MKIRKTNILEEDVLKLGFRIYEKEENDTFYKVSFKNTILGTWYLSGNFIIKDNKQYFNVYGIDRLFDDIEELKLFFLVNNFIVDTETTNKYGSDIPIRDNNPYNIRIDKSVNFKSINQFIVELLQISDFKRQLELVMRAPNNELVPPQIKMGMENNGKISKMMITI